MGGELEEGSELMLDFFLILFFICDMLVGDIMSS